MRENADAAAARRERIVDMLDLDHPRPAVHLVGREHPDAERIEPIPSVELERLDRGRAHPFVAGIEANHLRLVGGDRGADARQRVVREMGNGI